VVVTHFVAINVAVGHASGDDRVVCFVPDNCSRTVLDADGDRLTVVELGEQVASTKVQ
jgi:broad specificity phosphatase PhoE